jgi:putative tricarboxylic transport membrane protein
VIENLLLATGLVFTPENLLFAAIGMAVGLVFGALPGLNGNVAIGLLIPFTYYLDPLVGIVALMAIGKGANFAGAVPAVLLNIPGTPAATFTAIDGNRLTKKGESKKALHMALWASSIGDLVSDLVLLLVAAPLAALALMVGPPEYAAIILVSLLIVGTMVGSAPAKGLISAALGILLGTVGRDLFTMEERFTFGIVNLDDGIPVIPLLMGLLVVSEILLQLRRELFGLDHVPERAIERLGKGGALRMGELLKQLPTVLKSSGIGTVVGAVPGLGATLGAFLCYTEAKRTAPSHEPVGKGSLRGIAAAEAGNSATNGSNLIPLVTLGIPGNVEAALVLGAFMIHGITPGPFLMQQQGPMLYAIFLSLILANLLLLAMGFGFVHLARYALALDKRVLLPVILLVAVFGTYATTRQVFDLGLMFLFGLLGYAMRRLGFTPMPMIIGFLLGPMLEDGIRRSLIMSGGTLRIFLERPITIGFLLLAAVVLIAVVRRTLAERRALEAEAAE